jgi:hypothetical protein
VSRAGSPFSPRVVLAVLVVGAGALLLMLYAIGAGWDGRSDRNGGAHAAANGLNGFAGLAQLLEARGYRVELSRSEGRLDDEGLLVLTPQVFTDADELAEIVEARRYVGPTLLILPKWLAGRVDGVRSLDVPKGWVALAGTEAPDWLEDLDGFDDVKLQVGKRRRWKGLGLAGALPEPDAVLTLSASRVMPLATDEKGDVLAGYLDDGGAYPVLDAAAGMPPRNAEDLDLDTDRWSLVVVAEPDLMNNYGMADRARAELAEKIVEAAKEGQDLPVVFDLTLAGLGQSENLLTLAFRPPFLAATLCLLLAALVIAWRSFRRFGPPVAEVPALAKGKRQLATNGAALVERARRLHLLGPPYAALVAARIAAALGIREADPAMREAAIVRALAARGLSDDFPSRIEALRHARHPAELLRAAGALRTIERTLTP